MNFLQGVKRLRQESDVPGTGPLTVIDQRGELKDLVDWYTTAYEDIQNMHSIWKFLQDSVSFQTVVGKSVYTPTEAGVPTLLSWKFNDCRIYFTVADEQFLHYEPWESYRPDYQFSTRRTQTGKPTIVTIKPDKSVELWPIPDKIYTFDGQCYKKPDVMELDADIPVFPDNFHLAIVWRALMFYGADVGANEKYAHGRAEYKKIMRKMELNQLPRMVYGEPLA